MYTETAYPVIDLAETGRRIERQRCQAGLTVRDLQTYFGFEYPQAIYKWQHGECLPTVDNLLALARLLRVSMEDLLVYDDQGVSHFIRSFLNQRFNDRHPEPCYSLRVDRQGPRRPKGAEGHLRPGRDRQERAYPSKKSGREPTSDERWVSCRSQARTAALSEAKAFQGNTYRDIPKKRNSQAV